MIDQSIFRAYDIRGTYPDQLNAETALMIGKGFASYLFKKTKIKSPRIVVGRDARTHGEELKKAFIEGLVTSGCQVTDIGLSSSPYLYFVNTEFGFDAGCNITASHNPKEYNGFKLMMKNAHAVFGSELAKIYTYIQRTDLLAGKGSVETKDYSEEYFSKISGIFQYPKPLKVVVDTANGIAGLHYPEFLKRLGHDVIGLYSEVDGTFPNHEPDPIVERNLDALKKKVIDEKAHIGLAFDGDGDRVTIVNEKGEYINPDKILMLLALDALGRKPGGSVVFTVSTSQTLFDLVTEWGGKPVMCKVGHSYVEDAMSLNKAIIGGEQSGHFFLPENYYSFDDALITACRILKIVSISGQPVSEIFSRFPKTYSIPEMRPKCADVSKFEVIDKVTQYFKDKYPANTMDGVRIIFGNGAWAGIRAGNTSPCISIIMEARSEEELEKVKSAVLGHMNTYQEIKWNE